MVIALTDALTQILQHTPCTQLIVHNLSKLFTALLLMGMHEAAAGHRPIHAQRNKKRNK
jgi:hypothetical protein